MTLKRRFLMLAAIAMIPASASAAPVLVGTWNFNNSFAADQVGAPAMTPIDPLNANAFISDTVFGETRTVYRFDGDRFPPANQAGLALNTTGLLDGDNSYSVEMVFQFERNESNWEEIFGVSNRTSDNSFYVQPNNTLQIYPTGGGPTIFTFGEYHDIILTNDGAGHVTAYIDGIFQFDLITSVMDFSSYAVENPDRLIHFFADNLIAGGQGEFADGRVALIRLYDNELTPEEVEVIGTDPIVTVPAPGAFALLGFGLLGLGTLRRREN